MQCNATTPNKKPWIREVNYPTTTPNTMKFLTDEKQTRKSRDAKKTLAIADE
jgi:hypothetical protein